VIVDRLLVPAAAKLGDHPLRLAQRIGADQHDRDGSECSRCSSRSISLPVSGWRNTGRPKVASVMKMSHGTGSNGAQVGSSRRL
jgi:hypothetical protein